MLNQKTKRIIIDIALVVLLVFEMFYLLTGNLLHEIVGVLFFVCLGFHLYLTRKMAGALFSPSSNSSQNATKTKRLHRAVDILLFGTVGLLLASSLFISNLLLGTGVDLAGEAYALWSLLHTVAAYVLCAVVVFHAAFHWVSLFKSLRIPYNPARREAITSVATACAAAGVVAVGLASTDSLKNHLLAFANEEKSNDPEQLTTEKEETVFSETRETETATTAPQDMPVQETTPSTSGGSRKTRASSSASGRSSTQSQANAAESDSTNSSASKSGSSQDFGSSNSSATTNTSDICPLCRKRCPLSAPQCNRPYQAGLI